MNNLRKIAAGSLAAVLAFSMAACGSSNASSDGTGESTGKAVTVNEKSAKATSLADFGTMEDLEKAAKEEGALNVIALPHDWSNYGEVIESFKKKYPEIKVTELNPNASSKEELDAAKTNKGTDAAPDVFDVGQAIAATSTDYFAPYKVQAWDKIPDTAKDADGAYYADYTGIMSVGWNADKYGDISSLDDLLDPKFAGTVALNGKPAEAGAAFNGYLMANQLAGGDINNLQPGLDYFKKLKEAGNLTTVDVTNGTIDSGQTGVVFDWTYNQASYKKELKDKGVNWKYKTFPKAQVVSYYNQAINKDAPHPPVGGVPVHRRRPEPVVQGRRQPGAARFHEGRRHRRPGHSEGRHHHRRRAGLLHQRRLHPHHRVAPEQLGQDDRQLRHRPMTAAIAPIASNGPAAAKAAGPSATPASPLSSAMAKHRQELGTLATTLPFFAYTACFLLAPTVIVIVGAFQDRSGNFTLANFNKMFEANTIAAFGTSILVSLASSLIGAVVGALASYALVIGAKPNGLLRRMVSAISSVLAQFGGVMLAFAFIATIGINGIGTMLIKTLAGYTVNPNWLSSLPGLVTIYCYFQIPLMIIIFLPAVDSIRPQWREACESLGGNTFQYWTRVACPILAPRFISAFLLLFASAFSAYATAAALFSQRSILVPLMIQGAMRNELDPNQQGFAQVLAFAMIIVVAIVMLLSHAVEKRAGRWQ